MAVTATRWSATPDSGCVGVNVSPPVVIACVVATKRPTIALDAELEELPAARS